MKSIHALLLASIIALGGCATAPKMNRLSVGMAKQEVVSAMGQPVSTAAPGGGIEILRYELQNTDQVWWGGRTPYFVRLVNGKVDSYGRLGDFDSTKDPTVNLNIKHQ